METLTVHEIYRSIQGESSWAGERCAFIRLTFCNLRCTYCDTEYAFYDGNKMALDDIVSEVLALDCPMAELTGGEPLLQPNAIPLMTRLCDEGLTVLLETGGSLDISKVDPRVHRIMDLKTPSSGEVDKNLWSNIELLTEQDEVKFVIGSEEDYLWAKEKIAEHGLPSRCAHVLLSPVWGKIDPRNIVDWMLRDQLDARFQLQMHKFIWDPAKKGV